MWVWHRKQSVNGFELLKKGEELHAIPENWRDHLTVVTKKRNRVIPKFIKDEKSFKQIVSNYANSSFDEEHRRVMNYLEENGGVYDFDLDHNMIVTHTSALKRAHSDLNLIGLFTTTAEGKEQGDKNCFMFPRPGGAWIVYRYSPGGS